MPIKNQPSISLNELMVADDLWGVYKTLKTWARELDTYENLYEPPLDPRRAVDLGRLLQLVESAQDAIFNLANMGNSMDHPVGKQFIHRLERDRAIRNQQEERERS